MESSRLSACIINGWIVMQKKCLFLPMLPLIICLSACAAIFPAPPQTPVPTNTDTPAPTPTIVWFPVPTPTDTVMPTTAVISPTPDLRPGIGAVILKDDFSDTSQWQTPRLTSSSVAYGNNELSVVVSQAGRVHHEPAPTNRSSITSTWRSPPAPASAGVRMHMASSCMPQKKRMTALPSTAMACCASSG